ncbi:F-box protein SKIP8-like, partial [Olea europaea var. sylvestris]|uniref:F-box protein SKIP8-like n=1 Tax=Olea europaea var. sylvestris TaxID=158386 RepID=UPI000C1CF968
KTFASFFVCHIPIQYCISLWFLVLLLAAICPNLYLFRTVPTRKASRSCRVRSEDCGGILSGESILLNEQTLERELQIAIEEENYAKAAKIRDSLKLLQEDSKASVLAANARFYNSFRNGDLASMQALWSKGDHVCVVHPGVSGISSHDLVMGSWEFVWADYDFPLQIEIKDLQVHVRGDIGYVTCIEMVKTKGSSWGRQFATNVFERIDGQWFMSVHHASYVDL